MWWVAGVVAAVMGDDMAIVEPPTSLNEGRGGSSSVPDAGTVERG